MRTQTTLVNNKIITYYEKSDNTNNSTLLLIHGLGGDHRGLINASSFIKNHRIIMVDLPGYGRSEPLDIEHNLENYVHFLNDFCNKLNINNFILAGHSFGGAIALMYSKYYSKNLKKLILLNPALKNNDNILMKLSFNYMKIVKQLPDRPAKFLMSNKLTIYVADKSIMTKEGKQYRKKILTEDYENHKRAHGRTMKESANALYNISIEDYVREQNIPIFVLLGNKDPLVYNSTITQLSKYLKNINIEVVSGGHLLPQENPKIVGMKINEFINN